MTEKMNYLAAERRGIPTGEFFRQMCPRRRAARYLCSEIKISKKKTAAIIIAFRNFRDEEYFVPKEILETAGAEITTVSTQTGEAIGADGGEVEVALSLKDLNVADFDAIIFIGGPGALKYLDNDESYRIAKEAVSQKKLLAAICISPVILAKAGVLEGKRATVWSSPLDREPVRILQDHGALYQAEPVVVDGDIITANGPAAAKQFGESIILALKPLTRNFGALE